MLPSRVIVLAPRGGGSGVGDYATDVIELLQSRVDIIDVRHGMPGEDTIRAMRQYRRTVRDLVRGAPPGTVVHAEVSGGSSPSFWALRGLRAARTATVHDAPRPYWFPLLTRGIARFRWVRAALLRLLSPLHLLMERRVMRDVPLMTLSDVGAQAVREARIGREVMSSRLLIPKRPLIAPPWDRPAAVGLFGHVYRGKGFEFIRELRELLPASVTLRVAGRGTEVIPQEPGVHVSGAVEGPDEDAWFASVRVVLLPYRRAPIGGVRAVAASAVQALAAAYETPSIALGSPAMDELAAEGGCETVPTLTRMAERAAALALNEDELATAHATLMEFRASRPADQTVSAYLQLWDQP